MTKFFLGTVLFFSMPVLVGAAGLEKGTGLGKVLVDITRLLDAVVPVVVIILLIYFFWGVAQYIRKSAEEGDREKARQIMIHGIIALFVVVSVWGLVKLIQQTFLGSDVSQQSDTIPSVQKRN